MSEFKFACPVCGQHMMCAASQGGAVMDCPTCFQKIVAPQAPADVAQKYILTGSKFAEKKNSGASLAGPVRPEADNKFLMAAMFALVLVLAAGGAAFIFPEKIFPSRPAQPLPAVNNEMVKPTAGGADWRLDPGTNALPDAPVAGRIHAQDFMPERAVLYNGTLVFRDGGRGPVTFGLTLNFKGALPEAFSGQAIQVLTNAAAAPRVTLHWLAGAATNKASFTNGYALRLEFGALADNKLPGKIYLCLPDAERSCLMGSFNADVRRPKPKR